MTVVADKLRELSLARLTQPHAMPRPAAQPRHRAEPARWPMRQVIGIAALGVAFGSIATGVSLSAPVAPVAVPTPATRGASIAPPVSANLVAAGFVVPRRGGTIGSQVTGQLSAVLVEEGDVVRAGQIVARIDDAEARARLSRALAEARRARSEVTALSFERAEAESLLARRMALIKRGFVTAASVDESQARFGALAARVDQAHANVAAFDADVQSARLLLDRHAIRAPFGGVVIDKNAEVGELVSPVSAGGGFTRTGVVTIVDMASLGVEVDVAEAYIGAIHAGQPVALSFDALPGERFAAVVAAIVPAADRNRATVRVGISLLRVDPRILPQMAAKAAFLRQSEGPRS